MREEVNNAVEFLVRMMGGARTAQHVIADFSQSLTSVLEEHYNNHWFPEKPFKGSAYRCIRIVNHKMDPLLSKAGRNSGLSDGSLHRMLPAEFTMWIDPAEVSYRIGEEGSIGLVYSADAQDSSDNDSLDSQSSDEALSDDSSDCNNRVNSPMLLPGSTTHSFSGINFEYLTAAVMS